jgi:hypothetical protein
MQQSVIHEETIQAQVDRLPVDNGRLQVWRSSLGQSALHAGQRFATGEALHGFSARTRVETPTRHSVQVSENEHILLDPTFLQYINHGCDPNVLLDVGRREFIALRPIAEGEEILYFYPSTEWVMTCPFKCHCHAKSCLAEIRGASFLPWPLPPGVRLSPHTRALLAHRIASPVDSTATS